jgi:hypothetical protein
MLVIPRGLVGQHVVVDRKSPRVGIGGFSFRALNSAGLHLKTRLAE